MLILDETYTGALLRQAAIDGFVSHAFDDDALYKDPTTSRLLNRGLNQTLRQDVLWDLLLFHPALCWSYDNLNTQRLLAEALISKPLSFADVDAHTSVVDERPELVLLFEKFILSALREEDKGSFSRTVLIDHVEFATKHNFGKLYADATMYLAHSSYEELQRYYREGFAGAELQLPGRSDRGALAGEDFTDIVLSGLTREKFEFFSEVRLPLERGRKIINIAKNWFLLTGLAREHDAVLRAKTPSVARSREGLSATSMTEGSKVVVKAWLSEVEVLPRMTGVEDVLRLREDKRFDAFRNAMMEWASSVSRGGVAEEKRLRDHIRTANRELTKLKRTQKVAGWATVLSLPVDGALFLLALPIPTSLIGAAFFAHEKIKSRKYDWIMFGR